MTDPFVLIGAALVALILVRFYFLFVRVPKQVPPEIFRVRIVYAEKSEAVKEELESFVSEIIDNNPEYKETLEGLQGEIDDLFQQYLDSEVETWKALYADGKVNARTVEKYCPIIDDLESERNV